MDEVNKLVSESLFNYLKENDVKILGEPLPHRDEEQKVDFEKILSLNLSLTWDWLLN